ncbi:hypothetical protein HPP92_012600 [Vanilla planifolia]|uniref:ROTUNDIFOLIA like 8 n=1 Tax=Vanilla planifolia TaxID=51239 RepID=A0A835R832_VANPL|nr:hypothetical protein HPP92_012600 [Vanilla planifolia]
MDEKWKLSKRQGSRSCARGRETSATGISGSGGPLLGKDTSASVVAGSRSGGFRSFASRCANLAKEQRARFYIIRRCVTMLICWRDYS